MHDINFEENTGLIWHVIHKKIGSNKYKNHGIEDDDLFQVGSIGLIKAIDRFDPSRDISFSTYAISLIHGEILRELRDKLIQVKFPRSVSEVVTDIVKKGNKEIMTEEKVMEDYGVNKERANMIMAKLHYSITSGDREIGDEDGMTFFETIPDEESSEESALQSIELEERLSVLDEKERTVVLMSLNGKKQTEIAKELDVTQVFVSRMLSRSIKKIEERFDTSKQL